MHIDMPQLGLRSIVRNPLTKSSEQALQGSPQSGAELVALAAVDTWNVPLVLLDLLLQSYILKDISVRVTAHPD
jgi:hypothetical protein